MSCLNDYHPVALKPITMKCFEKLVRSHIISSMPPRLDPHQFAYRAHRSTEDAVATALHSDLSHLEERSSYVRMLFVDFSSAFTFRTDWCSNCQTWDYHSPTALGLRIAPFFPVLVICDSITFSPMMVSSSRISPSLMLELLMLISLRCLCCRDNAATPLPKSRVEVLSPWWSHTRPSVLRSCCSGYLMCTWMFCLSLLAL